MTPVKLTESERLEVRNSTAVQNMYQSKIIERCSYNLGLNNGDSTWAKSLFVSSTIKSNPSFLLNDSNLMITLEFNLLLRGFAFKDTDGGAELDDQVLSYLNDKWGYLIDDYFSGKLNTLPS